MYSFVRAELPIDAASCSARHGPRRWFPLSPQEQTLLVAVAEARSCLSADAASLLTRCLKDLALDCPAYPQA